MEVCNLIAKGIISSLFKILLKKDWEQKVDQVYQRALARWIDNDEIRKSEYIHKYKHFEDLETYINKGEVQKSTEALVILLMEELNKDPETHTIIADIRLENIQEGVSETNKLSHQVMADLTSLGEVIRSGFNSLKAQNVKGKYDLPKNHFLKLYKVPVEPAPFIERTVSPEKEISFWDYKETTLLSLCQGIETENNRFVILSSGGVGKSTELQHVAHKLAQSELYYPIYFPLKNYIVANSLSTSLPEYWDYDLGEKVIIFFDGLDEIPLSMRSIAVKDIQQIANNHPEITIVVTCRSNYYNDNFDNFECFFLNSFRMVDVRKYLEIKGMDYDLFFSFIDRNKLVDYSKNPFFLQAIIKFYDKNKARFDVTRKEILDYLILASYDADDKHLIDSVFYEGKEMLSKLAWAMQLSEENSISEEDVIRYIVGDRQGPNILRSFSVVKIDNENNFYFEHNSIKELLIASLLVTDTFENICTYICYDGTKIIKPSWYNTSIMLLSFMEIDNPVFKRLVEMMFRYNPNVLLKSERFKLSEKMRYDLAYTVWEKIKIKKTWMNYSEVDDLAIFGSDARFIDFCLQEAVNLNNSDIIRINACLLLARFEYRANYADTNIIIQSLEEILADKTENISIRQSVLIAFSNNFLKTQINFEQIYTILKDDEILLKDFLCIIPYGKVENFIPIIIENIELFGSRREGGTNYVANYNIPFDLLGYVTSEKGLLTLVGFLANNCSHLSSESQYTYDELVLRTLANAEPYLNSSSNLLDAILNLALEESKMSFGLDKKYVTFFSKSIVNDLVLTKLCDILNTLEDRDNHYYAVGTLVNDQNFDKFIDKLTISSLIKLSDSIYNQDVKWQFKDQITVRTGTEFDQSMRYDQSIMIDDEKREIDILFDIDKFREYLLPLFVKEKQMDWKQFLEILKDSIKIGKGIFIQFVGYFTIRDHSTEAHMVDIASLRYYLEDEFAFNTIAMQIVYNKIHRDNGIPLSDDQVLKISRWVESTLKGYSKPLEIWKTSLRFIVHLDIMIDSEVFLKLVTFYGFACLTNDEWAEFMQKAIIVCSLDSIKNQIRENYTSKIVDDYFVYKAYVDFIEKHEQFECYNTALDDLQDPLRFGEDAVVVQDRLVNLLCNNRQFALKVWRLRSNFAVQLRIDMSEVILNSKTITLEKKVLDEILAELIYIYNSEKLSVLNKQRIILLLNAYGMPEGLDLLIDSLTNNEYEVYLNMNFRFNHLDIESLEKYLIILKKIILDSSDNKWLTDWYKNSILQAVMNGIKNLAIISENNRKRIEDNITTFISGYVYKEKILFLYKLIEDCNNLFREKGNSAYTIEEAMILFPHN